ncbi:MAG TPA: hypothetical protein VFY18_05365 [Candidatus Limnocylindrales bacterium]|nr:hypothetical protein [Candidatus Limnocylindrales bacterium]
MRRATIVLAVVVGAAYMLAGCGGGPTATASPPPSPTEPPPGLTAAVAQTRGAIVAALTSGGIGVQLGDATRPYRPAESGRLRDAPRAIYQVLLPDQPDAGFIVVYEFPDTASAVDAGNEEAGYLGTGPAKVQFPLGTEHVVQAVGTTLVLYNWLPSASPDPTAGKVADALKGLGIGFSVPR